MSYATPQELDGAYDSVPPLSFHYPLSYAHAGFPPNGSDHYPAPPADAPPKDTPPRRRRISSAKALEEQQQQYLTMDPVQLKQLSKAERKKLREHNRNLTCFNCKATSTPLWRRTHDRKNNLCNACGLYYKQYQTDRPIKNQPNTSSSGSPAPVKPKPQRSSSSNTPQHQHQQAQQQPPHFQPQQLQDQQMHPSQHQQQQFMYAAAPNNMPAGPTFTQSPQYATNPNPNAFYPTDLQYGSTSSNDSNGLVQQYTQSIQYQTYSSVDPSNPRSAAGPQSSQYSSHSGNNAHVVESPSTISFPIQMPPFSTMTGHNGAVASQHHLPALQTQFAAASHPGVYTPLRGYEHANGGATQQQMASPAIDPALENHLWANDAATSVAAGGGGSGLQYAEEYGVVGVDGQEAVYDGQQQQEEYQQGEYEQGVYEQGGYQQGEYLQQQQGGGEQQV
ncbi:hypothetical protein HDU98_010510 [Podochytrium sp. JEL0797]|nr:hypothetical protein HDU98_010510 [Podochytrium sp. JEL0797]